MQTSVDIVLTILDDSTVEGDENFFGLLDNPLEEPVLLATSTAFLTILDANDSKEHILFTSLPTNDGKCHHDLCEISISLWEFIWGV